MPYIEAKLSIELNDNQRDELQTKLVQAVSLAFSKIFNKEYGEKFI